MSANDKDNDGATPLHFAAARGYRANCMRRIYKCMTLYIYYYMQVTSMFCSGFYHMVAVLKEMTLEALQFMMQLNMDNWR